MVARPARPSTYFGWKVRSRSGNIKRTELLVRSIGWENRIVFESLFSWKNDPREDIDFSSSSSQGCGKTLVKGVLAFGNTNFGVNQRGAALCEPMQGTSSSRFRLTRDLAEKIVHCQHEPGHRVLPARYLRLLLLDHEHGHFEPGIYRAQVSDHSGELAAGPSQSASNPRRGGPASRLISRRRNDLAQPLQISIPEFGRRFNRINCLRINSLRVGTGN